MTIWDDERMQPSINIRMIKNLKIIKGFNEESKARLNQIKEKSKNAGTKQK